MSHQAPVLSEVTVLRIPVPIWAQTQEHLDELIREFTLIAAQQHDEVASHEVPVRLLQLVEELTGQYGGLNSDQENRLTDAAQTGQREIDLVYSIPSEAGEGARRLQALLDDADTYCRAGTHLLTLASAPELARFRHWFLGEFINQLDGQPPTPFPEYAGA